MYHTSLWTIGLFVLVISAFAQQAGPANDPLPNYDVIFNGKCRLCEVNCAQFVGSVFSSCQYKYYRYGCDANYFCLKTNDLRYYEKYVAVAFCAVESGCTFRNSIDSLKKLEDQLSIPSYLSYATYYDNPSDKREKWLEYLAARNAYVTTQIYKIVQSYPQNSQQHQTMRVTYLRPILLSYIHPGPGPLMRFKQALDLYDMINYPTATAVQLQAWSKLPSWFLQAMNPITSTSEANVFLSETNWMTKTDSLAITTPEFFFYKHSLGYLENYAYIWADRYRTYTECNANKLQSECAQNSRLYYCDTPTLKGYCASYLTDLGISWLIEDMRIFNEDTYYSKQLAILYYRRDSNRVSTIRARQDDLNYQRSNLYAVVSRSTTIRTEKLNFVPAKPSV